MSERVCMCESVHVYMPVFVVQAPMLFCRFGFKIDAPNSVATNAIYWRSAPACTALTRWSHSARPNSQSARALRR